MIIKDHLTTFLTKIKNTFYGTKTMETGKEILVVPPFYEVKMRRAIYYVPPKTLFD